MKDAHPILLFIPLAVGSAAVICTILIHALPLSATVNFIRREKQRGRLGINFRTDVRVVMRIIVYAFVAHLIEMALWATLFMICGNFRTSPRPITTRRLTTHPWGMATSS
jgi:hypothetical protein